MLTGLPLAVSFYEVVVWIHISAVIVAFGGLFTYPVWFSQVRAADAPRRAFFHRTQGLIGRYVVTPGLLVVVLAGAYLATDRGVWAEVWVTVPLVIALVLGGLGGAYFGPREERLAELAESGCPPEYDRLFAQVQNVSYAALGLVLLAAFFMVTELGG